MDVRRKGKGRAVFVVALFFAFGAAAASSFARQQTPRAPGQTKTQQADREAGATTRARYRINLTLDADARTFSGTERVRWINRDDRPASVLYFHLYANHRGGDNGNGDESAFAAPKNSTATPNAPEAANGAAQQPRATADEPRLEVTEVRAVVVASAGSVASSTTSSSPTTSTSGSSSAPSSSSLSSPLNFSLDAEGSTMRVQLRAAVAPGASAEVEIAFRGSVPAVGVEETSLTAHVVQQVGAALRDTREWRGARDANFHARGVTLLGTPYPVLAARGDNGDWQQRRVEASVGDFVHAEAADYEVIVTVPEGVAVYTSGAERGQRRDGVTPDGTSVGNAPGGDDAATRESVRSVVRHEFAGENLRSFAVVAGEGLRAAEREVAGVRVRSIYAAEHEATGRRVLAVASKAVEIFTARFGALPFKSVTVAEAPLVAGAGSAEFSAFGVIASAFYVDFDAPATRNLPQIVREQRASVEDSLEFAVAHVVAHAWWGASVGNDPQREPVLDEALAHWSALYYYEEAHGTARAAAALDEQLRGVYQIYRTFGGEDAQADRAAREYRNSFQYAAIVSSKGALMFAALRKLMGDERFKTALGRYHEANRLEVAELEDLEAAFVAEVPVADRRALTRTFKRWLEERRGDEDISPPNAQLAEALGVSVTRSSNSKDGNAFARLGKFFWRQMTRIR